MNIKNEKYELMKYMIGFGDVEKNFLNAAKDGCEGENPRWSKEIWCELVHECLRKWKIAPNLRLKNKLEEYKPCNHNDYTITEEIYATIGNEAEIRIICNKCKHLGVKIYISNEIINWDN